jgi:ubiquinone biosynthesis protein
MALEELGATFIKLGQILSTRADLLPIDYRVELAKLQDGAPFVPSEQISETIEAELGRPVQALFAAFDPAPLAAASIGQAHAATLHCGTQVVVKVRRPGVVEQVEEDLQILQELAAAAARRWDLAERYDVVGLAQEFAQTMEAELDYIHEGRNADRFAVNFEDDPTVHIPRVFWELTTSRVLTLERIRGLKVDDLQAVEPNHIDRRALADSAAAMMLKMVFEDGFFHADPHPGNFFIEQGGSIGLIDFGMTGSVDERTQEHLAELLLAIATEDTDRLVDVLLDLGVSKQRANRALLRRDLDHLMASYYGKSFGEIAIGPLLNDAFGVIREHQLCLPPNLALLVKTVIMSESVGARLDPTFHLTEALVPYARQLMLRQYSPRRWKRKLGRASLDLARLGVEMPQQLRRIMGEFERGEIEVGMRPEGFEPIIRRLERLTNRIVLGVIAAAFINGLAVLMSVYRPPGWDRWAWVAFAIGFVMAAALGAYLAWSILRSGRG